MSTPSLFNTPPLFKDNSEVSQAPEAPQHVEEPQAPAVEKNPAMTPTIGLITENDLKSALPATLRSSVSQSLVDKVNRISSDPIAAENIRNNFVSYTSVMKEGRFKIEDYLNAVAYVSYKLMGYNNEESYAKTFPQRYADLLAKNTSKKDISAYVSAYHRGKLVNLIMEQSLVPSWVLNQDLFQKALNVQAELMATATSEKVRTDAANSILTHLKKPEKDFQLNINTEDSSGMREMRDTLSQLAAQQRQMIEQGQMKTIDVAAARLVNKKEDDDV
jgi:hypothetical protein